MGHQIRHTDSLNENFKPSFTLFAGSWDIDVVDSNHFAASMSPTDNLVAVRLAEVRFACCSYFGKMPMNRRRA